MTASDPPRLATWMLTRFTYLDKRESLVGDLVEEYRLGRSRAWYWRQALITASTSIGRYVWDHQVLAIRSIALGFLIMWGLWSVLYVGPLQKWIWNFTIAHDLDVARILWFGRWGYLGVGLFASALTTGFLSGYAIARSERRFPLAMIVLFMAGLLVVNCVWTAPAWRLGWNGGRGYLLRAGVEAVYALMPSIGVLLGGLWAVRHRSATQTGVC